MKLPSRQGSASAALSSSSYRFVIAGLTLLVHLAVGLNMFAVSPLLPLIIDDYSINRTTAALLVTLALLVSAGFGLPGGVIIARLGVRRASMAGWCLLGLPALSVLAPNFGTMLALRLSYGIGLALLLTATGPLLMRWFRPKEVLIMTGLNTAALSLGIGLSVSTAAPLADAVGWAGALSLFGVMGVLGAAAWLFLGGPAGEADPSAPVLNRGELWAVLSSRPVLLLVAADAGVLIQYTALTSWLPSFYNESRGLSLAQAGFATGLLPIVGGFAVLLGGVLPRRFGSKRVIFLVSGVMIGVGGPGAFLMGNLGGIYASLVILGIGSWLYVPVLLSLPMELPGMTPEKVALVWGFFITLSGFGMFLSPLLVGGLRDVTGSFLPGFAVCAVAAWALLMAGILMPQAALARERPQFQD